MCLWQRSIVSSILRHFLFYYSSSLWFKIGFSTTGKWMQLELKTNFDNLCSIYTMNA